jgi:hypothetical protein
MSRRRLLDLMALLDDLARLEITPWLDEQGQLVIDGLPDDEHLLAKVRAHAGLLAVTVVAARGRVHTTKSHDGTTRTRRIIWRWVCCESCGHPVLARGRRREECPFCPPATRERQSRRGVPHAGQVAVEVTCDCQHRHLVRRDAVTSWRCPRGHLAAETGRRFTLGPNGALPPEPDLEATAFPHRWRPMTAAAT